MEFRIRAAVAALVIATVASLAAGVSAAPRHHHRRHHRHHKATLCTQREPMACLAARHGWGAAQVADEWLVLFRESSSTPGHLNLTAVNGSCYGSGQLNGGPAEYYHFGGNPYTVAGQETADLNYVAGRYGSPAAAWAHELADGWY